MTHTETVITVSHLYKKFGKFTANDDLNFEVYRGEIFGFLGANGAGKTTAMRILCGLSSPTSGTAMVAGYNVAEQPELVKRNIGYMSQKFSLYEDLTIWENMRLYAGIYGVTGKAFRDRAENLLSELHFLNHRHELIAGLSLGWKQKLAFTVALIHRPAIVFLDEPTGGVDPVTRRQFWEMIYEAAHQGTTIFVTTHYMDEAEYCDRITIMADGKIKALDTPGNLKASMGVETMNEVFVGLTR
ncbi:ABC-2 type transport system ATP-binding protein [Breznakibacter xylanolyticus]|uniref:ABC-2 type transport system ATP-binding protein n=1 Tax=Breznakibacter xylanolyticus TaxID=990 RepID=A0A2W7NBY9_9BACT|nr:ABC transporter ATP-binding protein [Breznakibacter xylanolyticus]PZX17881.1 ABC-2 type transport system ATP-binding protein [Breznakibacter xylanolyticus]